MTDIKEALRDIGEIDLLHGLKVKPVLYALDIIRRKTIVEIKFYIGKGPMMDVLPPPRWELTKPGWGYPDRVKKIAKRYKEVEAVIRCDTGLRLIYRTINPLKIRELTEKILMDMTKKASTRLT